MSSTEETPELKAGHPPAVKAGGMRVSRPRQTSTGEGKEASAPAAEGEEQYSSTPPKSEKHNQKVLMQGVVTHGDSDFKAEAVKHYHDKPMPSKEKNHNQPTHNIHQPR